MTDTTEQSDSQMMNAALSSGAGDRALIEKYESEILAIMDMNLDEKKAVFRILGLDENEIKNKPEYRELQVRDQQNFNELLKARDKIKKTTTFATIAAFAGSVFASVKGVFDKQRGVQVIFTLLSTFFAAVTTYFFATKIFAKRAMEKGAVLSKEARDAEAMEIARALEKMDTIKANKEAPEAATVTAETLEPAAPSGGFAAKGPAPSPSYAEKARLAADTSQMSAGR